MSDDGDDANSRQAKTRRITPASNPGPAPASDGYKVGYKKPPAHSRFKPGQPSANPKGRPKGSSRVNRVTKILNRKIKLNQGGRTRTVPFREALHIMAGKEAMGGNVQFYNALVRAEQDLAKIEANRAPTREEIVQDLEKERVRKASQARTAKLIIEYLDNKAERLRLGLDFWTPEGILRVVGWGRLAILKPEHRDSIPNPTPELIKLMSDLDAFLAEDPKYGLPSTDKMYFLDDLPG